MRIAKPPLRTSVVHGCRVLGDAGLRITGYPSGPTLVRGVEAMCDRDGRPVELRRGIVAICRCEHSRITPFCDGTHRFVPGFDEPSGREPRAMDGRS